MALAEPVLSVIDRHGDNRVVHSVPVLPQTYAEFIGEPMLWLCLGTFTLGTDLLYCCYLSDLSSVSLGKSNDHACSCTHYSVNCRAYGCSGTDPNNLRPWEEEAVKRSGSATLTKDYGSKLEEGKPHVVEKGDTLYSIAFRLGIDFRELAARNDIQPPYIIKVGQTLRTARTVPQPEKQSSKVDLSRTISSKKPNKSVPKKPKVTSVTKPSLKSQALSDTVRKPQSVSRWHWPSAGRLFECIRAIAIRVSILPVSGATR